MDSTTQDLKIDLSGGPLTSRLPLVVRTSADVKALRANSRAVRRLPRTGLKIAIDGLDPCQAQKLQERISAYVQSCGCAEGGATALVAIVAVLALLTLQISARGPRWGDLGAAAMGLLLAMLLGGLAKLLGLTIARLRFKRCCSNVIRMTNTK
ncbi:hypothetical protein OKW43_008666 [Paraburkholderia sp. WC7.3g]|uniref:hypothetical protein n=1 Tax=Paraburkholderia sp. WC7.3g TaxID=2991070 RepID=UPI003D1F7739